MFLFVKLEQNNQNIYFENSFHLYAVIFHKNIFEDFGLKFYEYNNEASFEF